MKSQKYIFGYLGSFFIGRALRIGGRINSHNAIAKSLVLFFTSKRLRGKLIEKLLTGYGHRSDVIFLRGTYTSRSVARSMVLNRGVLLLRKSNAFI